MSDTPKVVIYGRQSYVPAYAARDYPELLARHLEMQQAMLLADLANAGVEPMGDITERRYYSKAVTLTERPDWAGEDDEPPWIEAVDCIPEEADTIMLLLEVLGASR